MSALTAAAYAEAVSQIEPAARVVPGRTLRRAIRQSRDRGTFRPRAVHDCCWWVRRDELFRWLTPPELGLSDREPAELLLIPAPEPDGRGQSPADVWQTLFHAAVDRELDDAARQGRMDDATIRRFRRHVGPARWQMIRTILVEENLIEDADPDDRAFREFAAFGLELARFRSDDWDAFFPALSPTDEPLRTVTDLLDVDALYERTRPRMLAPDFPVAVAPAAAPAAGRSPDAQSVGRWIERGNDLKAAVVLARAARPRPASVSSII